MADLYRSRPTDIEAVQWLGFTGNPESPEDLEASIEAVVAFAGEKITVKSAGIDGRQLYLLAGKDGAQGWVPVPVLHWIVRLPGDDSDLWPVDDQFFTGKYEPVVDEPAKKKS